MCFMLLLLQINSIAILLGRNSQNFLGKFLIFFIILGLKILRLFWFQVIFEADIIKG